MRGGKSAEGRGEMGERGMEYRRGRIEGEIG